MTATDTAALPFPGGVSYGFFLEAWEDHAAMVRRLIEQSGARTVCEIGGGREHVIALRSDATVWSWGSNQYGQAGNGSTANRPTPGPVAGLIAYHAGQVSAGRALVIYGCAFMAACGVVLFISDRRLWRGMVGQSAPPLIALIAACGVAAEGGW